MVDSRLCNVLPVFSWTSCLSPLHPRQSRCVRKIRQGALDVNGYSCWSIESGQYIVILSVTKNNLQWWFWMIIMQLWIIRFSTHSNPVEEALFIHCDRWEQWYLEKLIDFPGEAWDVPWGFDFWHSLLYWDLIKRALKILPFPSPGDLPDSGIKPTSPALQANSLPLSHQGSPINMVLYFEKNNSAKEFKDKGETWRTLSQRWIRLFF